VTDSAESERARLVQRALHGRGLMRYRTGRYTDAVSDLGAARALAEEDGRLDDVVELLLDEATALDWADDWRRSAERVARARQLGAAGSSPLFESRLLMSEGRTAIRFSDWAAARRSLEKAVERADALGDEGYETLVVALLLLGFILPSQGAIGRADDIFARLRSLCEARGDKFHLAATINNRRSLWIARKDVASAIADARRYLALGTELGMLSMLYYGEFNLAELLYQHGELADAWSHAVAAGELELRMSGGSSRRLPALLQARILLVEGKLRKARAIYEELRGIQAEARAAGRTEAQFVPSEEILFALIDLCTRPANSNEWDALQARAPQAAIDQEPIEIVELRGLTAARYGDSASARRYLEDALALARDIPTVMEERIRRHLAVIAAPHRPEDT
jgi:tetratricopeptide (TPR) repeat protein